MSSKILEKVFSKYSSYKEPGLEPLWLTHAGILPKISNLSKNKNVTILEAGHSIEGRSIFKIKMGRGNTRILLWSQMHGNETTATKAIFDLLNFLTANDEFSEFKNELLNALEIHFIPMLNPDGAEKFTRENAINIDLNRDALSFQSPEAQILQKAKDEINPEFCFNLHDQNRYYGVGRTGLSPVLSFLAPPSDYNNPMNDSRQKAMKLIAYLTSILEKYIPSQIAKYSDDHEPRSFGDNFNKQNSAVILIESGYLKNDLNKEKVREYNFIALLSALSAILTKSYDKTDIADYSKIPENNEAKLFDLLLKGVKVLRGNNEFIIDIGINRREFTAETKKEIYIKGVIEGLGDLCTYSAHEIIDCRGLIASEGKILFNHDINNENLCTTDFGKYYADGYTTIARRDYNSNEEYCKTPMNIILRDNITTHEIKTGLPANLYLRDKNGAAYLIVNGFLLHFPINKNLIRNGLIFR